MRFLKDFGAIVALLFGTLSTAFTYGVMSNKVDNKADKEEVSAMKQELKDLHEDVKDLKQVFGLPRNGRK